jgi:LacI family transcriptional regulator
VAEVAALAGVGKATAARTLGNYGSVSPAARARVMAAAEKLRYRPNNLARSMTTGRTQTIGVVVADIGNPFFGGVMRGITDRCEEDGYAAIVLSTDETLEEEKAAVSVLMRQKVDGLIVASAAVTAADAGHLQDATARGIPVVLMDRLIEGIDLPAVIVDNREAIRNATRFLLREGHDRIAFAWGPVAEKPSTSVEDVLALSERDIWSATERLHGYLEALDGAGIPFDPALVTGCELTVEDTAIAVRDMLTLPEPPTAILTTETNAMVGALQAIRQSGLSYPRDVSLIGFDDNSWSSVMDPPLTMIAQPMTHLGETAAEQLMAIIAGTAEPAHTELMRTEFRERRSTAPPRTRGAPGQYASRR